MSKNEFVPVLASFGFSLKTKAFNSILSNPKSDYEKYVKVLSSVLPKNEAEVYGVILFNSHLNGSYVNWGVNSNSVPHRIGRAGRILFSGLSQADCEVLIKGLLDVIQVKTFRRWESALSAVKNKQEWIKSQALLLEIAAKAEAEGLRLKSVKSQALSTEPKELTLKEIESLLGFKVKIIS